MELLVILQVISTVFAGIALFYTALKIRKSGQQRKAELINSCWKEFWSSKDVHDMYYKIEYDHFIYDEEFRYSDEEKKLDRLINLFQQIAIQYNNGLIDKKDLKYVSYHYKRVFKNEEVQKYLDFIRNYSKDIKERYPYIEAEELIKVM